MSPGLYKSLPLEPNNTRMVRLLPDKETNAEIKCELFTYDLTEIAGRKHLYEALSYVWSGDQEGSAEERNEIKILGHTVPITANLHAALVNLRDHQLERVLWIDAICINQDDLNEKSNQIPLMRTIYAQADRVIVWLGEAFEHGDKALETIRDLAEQSVIGGKGPDTKLSESNNESCLKLLQRKWFRRIWVLQEVGVARSIEIMCGSVQINGYTFCEGLSQLKIPSLLRPICPVVYLIRGAQFRPRNAPSSRGSLHIGELIEMYRYHKASRSHDKVYALLGLAADDPNTPGLKPDYNLPWHEVLKNTIEYILSGKGFVEAHPDMGMAIIQTKCWILGSIYFVQVIPENNQQELGILFNDCPESVIFKKKWGYDWIIQASAKPVKCGDILCLLRGNPNPCIIRVSGDHFTIINIAITSQQIYQNGAPDAEPFHAIHSSQSPPFGITLTWTILVSDTEKEVDLKGPMKLIDIAAYYHKECLETEKQSTDLRATVDAIAMNLMNHEAHCSLNALKHLLAQLRVVIPVSEQVVKAAVGNTGEAGQKIVEVLLQYQDNLPVTEDVVKVAARNEASSGCRIMEVLFKYCHSLPITQEVVKAVAENKGFYAPQMISLLFEYRDDLQITEEVVKAVAENEGTRGADIMEMLFQHQKNLPVTEEVVKAAARNEAFNGHNMMSQLFRYHHSLPVTEEVVKAAAGNMGLSGLKIMEILFKHQPNMPVTEEVVKAVARNEGSSALGKMELLVKYHNNIPVTEEVVKAVAGNEGRFPEDIMRVLFEHQDGVLISEEMVTAMKQRAGPDRYNIVMEMFFRHQEMRKPGWKKKFQSTAKKFQWEGSSILSTKHHTK